MGRRDLRHGRRRAGGRSLRWLPVVLVLALLGAAAAAYRFDLGARWFGTGEPDPRTEPAAVAPPPGLELPVLHAPEPVAAPGEAPDPRRAAVRRALAPLLDDKDLGRHVVAAVGPLEGRGSLVTAGRGTAMPASTTKLLTTTAALETLGPDHVFETSVVGRGGRVVLVGGGDPFLARSRHGNAWPERADLVTLARETAEALDGQGRHRVSLAWDDSLFAGPAVNPHWPADYVPGVVSPIAALWVDEGATASGYGRATDPAAAAAEEFAGDLRRFGVEVRGKPRRARAGDGLAELASVQSAPLSRIVERVLAVSDNEAAEVLARHVGLAVSGTGSSRAGTAAVLRTLRGLGVRTDGARMYDGSGLSREDRLSATTLLDVLRVAAAPGRPDLRAVVTGLPVAGFTGSLEFRFVDTPDAGKGRVRAKTGTLSGVSGLAGVATDLDGTTYAFALIADRVALADTLDAREALDDAAAALGTCHCSS